mmetsp:Transcript_28089/g.83931  ORF Transcript_28089/g.83931 Transcript_28089/m.83931 type:complete len:198 (-) Transcript_28089:192-785(-)
MMSGEGEGVVAAPGGEIAKPLTVVVGSKNPVKIAAVEGAFAAVFPTTSFAFEGVDVGSGVADQPMGDAETLQGAQNRAARCREARPTAAFTVGLEGGCKVVGGDMACIAWMCVLDSTGTEGKASAAQFLLPRAMSRLVESGLELGDATDKIFKKHNSKQAGGCIGSLTNGLITRAQYYHQPLIMALLPFTNREMYAE